MDDTTSGVSVLPRATGTLLGQPGLPKWWRLSGNCKAAPMAARLKEPTSVSLNAQAVESPESTTQRRPSTSSEYNYGGT